MTTTAEAAPEPATLPTPSLARGGGAIGGMGERFEVSALTGTATASVPLGLTAGRAGFTPALALTYDSGAGNSPFGLGWGVGVPAVSRRTDRGVPRYGDADTVVLSGADDLLPALRSTPGGWTPVVRTDGGFEVRGYRPRVEGGFSRIERWTDRISGDVHWRTTSPANVTSVFGRTSGSRIEDPADRRRVFSWLLEETFDDRGNVAVYEYQPEDLAGIDPAERARGAQPQRYLKRIRYGNAAPGVRDGWHFEVVLDYGEHGEPAPTPVPVRPWPHRRDAFSTGRPGFEVTTRRLCRRVLMFHRFHELGAEPYLVRATELRYLEEPTASLLVAVTHVGFTRLPSGAYERAALPPVEFGYTASAATGEVHTVDAESVQHLPYGLDGQRYQWVDLDGDGVAGVLTEHAGAWRFARNLGGGRLGAAQVVARTPSIAGPTQPASVLSDLNGDGGLSLVTLDGPAPGFTERTADGDWTPFTPFPAVPNLSWADPNLRTVDLDGDGRPDVLVSCDGVLRWHRSLGRDGYSEEEVLAWADDEDRGPRLVFTDGTRSVQFADMTGDGLADLVRVDNAEVCYWPNLGHGRFAPKVVLRGAPVLDHPGRFDPSRVRLFDVDGTGPSDLVYLGPDGVRLWPNESGRSLGPQRRVGIPALDAASGVGVVDLLGTGTASLVWSSTLPADAGRQMRYVELTGGAKPLLLNTIRNNLGGETTLTYASSTRFVLADAAAGRPWVTRLPFPVHVVERVEATDAVTGCRYATSHRYRHGFYDRREREFRGFACVETTDVESFEGGAAGELDALPALTKTWYHTGAYLQGAAIARALAAEYYAGDPLAADLPDTVLPPGLTAAEEPDAVRALRGMVLRTEVYGLDGSVREDHPYAVTESSYRLRLVQPRAGAAPPVFHPHAGESLAYSYERRPDDPRVTHQITLEVDEFGVVTRAATVAYPRRIAVQPEQSRTLCTVTEATAAHRPDEPGSYRVGVPVESRTFELTGLPEPGAAPYPVDILRSGIANARQIPFDATPAADVVTKRLLGRTRTRYLRDDLSGSLPFGEVGSRALMFDTRTLAAPETLLTTVFGARLAAGTPADEGGYVRDDGGWWVPSGRLRYDPDRFFQPTAATDPFGNTSTLELDQYAIMTVRAVDPLGNTVRAVPDYRTMSPSQVTDPNGNRTAVATDPLGRVVGTAVLGKPGAGEGDTLDDPTARFVYADHEYLEHGRPTFAQAIHRETHGPGSVLRHAFSYTDGLGREVMAKAQAAPGLAPARSADGGLLRNPDGSLVLAFTVQRWIGSGRTVFDRKGNPVRQYEPFFSSTPAYESEAELVETGVSPTLRYDPLGRTIRVDNPDGTYSKVEFDAWRIEQWDTSDTVLDSAWLAERAGLAPADPDGRAAALARAHAATPTIGHLDPAGRPFLAIADTGTDGRLEVRSTLDIAGNVLTVTDPRGTRTVTQIYDALNRPLRAVGAETGESLLLLDIAGTPIRTFGARGFTLRPTFDALRRPTHMFVTAPDGTERVAQRVLYGEALPDGTARNLRGIAFQTYDPAGVSTVERLDFTGNPLGVSRRLVREFRAEPDWSPLAAIADPAAVAVAAEPLLDDETFTARTEYDALNRPTRTVAPDGSEQLPVFNEAGLLERLDVRLPGVTAPTAFVSGVEYEADGRRAGIDYGNGVATRYAYDPRSRRLTNLASRRAFDNARLQDLHYTYDAAGNIVALTDAAQQTLFFRNAAVSPTALYEYDALHRLRRATGREHAGTGPADHTDVPGAALPHPNDATVVRGYVEHFGYDAAGNITQVRHTAERGSWTRRYAYEPTSNRLMATSLPGDGASGPLTGRYLHDVHGNITRMPHLAALDWDFAERLVRVDLGGGGTAFYTYDAAGQRVRAVVQRPGGLTEERIYLGGFELFRRRTGTGSLADERSTLHVADDTGRVAIVEIETVAAGVAVTTPIPAIRFQLGNHLGSVCLEVDETAALVSYEEYHPYGTPAYRCGRSETEVSRKRYRFTGKERDAETGFTYHGARYYAPWLGRWTAPDPAGFVDGSNLYVYARNQPTAFVDRSGTQAQCDPTIESCEPPAPEICRDEGPACEAPPPLPEPKPIRELPPLTQEEAYAKYGTIGEDPRYSAREVKRQRALRTGDNITGSIIASIFYGVAVLLSDEGSNAPDYASDFGVAVGGVAGGWAQAKIEGKANATRPLRDLRPTLVGGAPEPVPVGGNAGGPSRTYAPNSVALLPRTEKEALDLYKAKVGVDLKSVVGFDFALKFVDALPPDAEAANAYASYGPWRRHTSGKVAWEDLLEPDPVTGEMVILIQVRKSVASSDEAIIGVLAHEFSELNTIYTLMSNGAVPLPAGVFNKHVQNEDARYAHGKAWESANQLVEKLFPR